MLTGPPVLRWPIPISTSAFSSSRPASSALSFARLSPSAAPFTLIDLLDFGSFWTGSPNLSTSDCLFVLVFALISYRPLLSPLNFLLNLLLGFYLLDYLIFFRMSRVGFG
ncbi:hypothetical protein E8E12_010169 [Didymella heteroderae]|uniref:Uncharacterized protein n=1 Tax=Didymella heteroderae TaxID=1769908 RepID=A0A9P4WZL8_9PLEO|nr:hypothetical protein E8E12_010169 [Didymella heteroderae]